jgi:hypothetical protein
MGSMEHSTYSDKSRASIVVQKYVFLLDFVLTKRNFSSYFHLHIPILSSLKRTLIPTDFLICIMGQDRMKKMTTQVVSSFNIALTSWISQQLHFS